MRFTFCFLVNSPGVKVVPGYNSIIEVKIFKLFWLPAFTFHAFSPTFAVLWAEGIGMCGSKASWKRNKRCSSSR